MMAIWHLESEKKKWSKVFDYFPKSVLSIVTSKKIENKQTNKPAIAI